MLALVLCLFAIALSAEISIDTIATPSGKYLVVTQPILVNPGDTLNIAEGRDVLFTNFSGITVLSGATLLARGTKAHPIYFTSLLDTSESAAAFDWNGIEIKKGGSAHFAFCFVAFSTSGITAEDSVGICLEDCIFSSNGQWNFSLAGVILQAQDLQPFSYKPALPPIKQPDAPQLAADTTAAPSVASPRKPRLSPRQMVLGGIGITFIAAGSAALFQSGRYRSDYNSYVPGNHSYDSALPAERKSYFNDLRGKYGATSAIGWSCIGLAVADGLFIAITVRF
jgi:hypothetical protein